jgi:hypothetical protein
MTHTTIITFVATFIIVVCIGVACDVVRALCVDMRARRNVSHRIASMNARTHVARHDIVARNRVGID